MQNTGHQLEAGNNQLYRALLIVNRKSRSGNSDLTNGISLLQRNGFNILEKLVENPGDITSYIHTYSKEIDLVILGGGDGTFHAAAKALLETKLPLGILPMGTANDLARTLSIPKNIEEACRIIAERKIYFIDIAQANDVYFFNTANIGLGVKVTRHLSNDLKSKWGIFSYARSVIKAIRDRHSFEAHIECDGVISRVASIQIAVGNGRYYGGGMVIAENADIDDHLLFMYSIKPLSLLKLLQLAPSLRTGRYQNQNEILVAKGKRISISTRKVLQVVTDGEISTYTPVVFQVIPSAVPVYVPESYLKDRQK